jgi:DNA-binding transcriptional ArsR family regulator
VVDVFEALADPVRRDIVLRLRQGPARVADLAAEHPISRPAVSRHLRVLREAGLVDVAAAGRERPHHLVDEGFEPVRTFLAAVRTPTAPIGEHHLDALELEVRRGGRRRTASHAEGETA